MKFESADLIYQPRGIRKCSKMGGITDSTKRYGFWKKFSTNWSGVFFVFMFLCFQKRACGQCLIVLKNCGMQIPKII
jgi:hypothetical protein